jgi:phosphomannomutase
MWESKKTISELKGELPKFWILKKRITVGRKTINYKRIISKLPAGKANRTDGLRIDWKDSWIHVRKSGTEPIVRVIAEARTSKKAQELCGKVMGMIG